MASETELKEKIEHNLAKFKQLLSNDLHKDDWIDLSISGIIGAPALLGFNDPSFERVIVRCNSRSMPAVCIGLLSLKNLYYDLKHYNLVSKYNEKLHKLNKKYTKVKTIAFSSNFNKMNEFKNITAFKYVCKYTIPVCLIGSMYVDDPGIPFLFSMISLAGYITSRLIESSYVDALLD